MHKKPKKRGRGSQRFPDILKKIYANIAIILVIVTIIIPSFFMLKPSITGFFTITKEDSTKQLFNVSVEVLPEYKEIFQGEALLIHIILPNLKGYGIADVSVRYSIKDASGNVIAAEEEIMFVEKQANFIRELLIPSDLKPGTYTALVEVRTPDGVIGTGSDSFEVKTKYEIKYSPKTSYYALGISIVLVLIALISFSMIILKKVKKKEVIKFKEKIPEGKIQKLEKELITIKTAYKSKFISEESYKKEKERIEKKLGIREEKPIEEKPKEKVKEKPKEIEEKKLIEELKKAIENNEIRKAKQLYSECREHYLRLPIKTGRKFFYDVSGLYKKLKLIEEKRKEEEIKRQGELRKKEDERKKREEEKKRKEEQLKKKEEERKRKEEQERKIKEEQLKKEEERKKEELKKEKYKEKIKKSKKLEKCYSLIEKVESYVMEKNIIKAKQLYVKCREEYLNLSNEEKREIYDKIEKLYNKLSSIK